MNAKRHLRLVVDKDELAVLRGEDFELGIGHVNGLLCALFSFASIIRAPHVERSGAQRSVVGSLSDHGPGVDDAEAVGTAELACNV